MVVTPETPDHSSGQRYWKKQSDAHFTIFDRKIGVASVVLAVLFVLGAIFIPQQIEGQVKQAVENTLRRVGLAMLTVEVNGQDVYLSGELATRDLKADIVKLHAIARGAGCDVALVGKMACPAKVFVSVDAAEVQGEKPQTLLTYPAAKPLHAIAPDARTHDFSIDKGADFVTIEGDIPNEKVRDLMLRQATNLSLAVIDNMRVTNEQASEYFPWALERAWAILQYLENGKIAWRSQRFSVAGQISSENEKRVQHAYDSEFFRDQLAGLKLDVRPVYNDVSTCNQAFAEVFGHETLEFEPQSAKIMSHSEGLLDRLAVLAEQCTLSFVVENHTDASADPQEDLALSQRRAEQVVAALTARGIDKNRLSAAGFGSTRLKKHNNTPIARMQNRRTIIVAE